MLTKKTLSPSSCSTRKCERPELLVMSARAKPAPSRKITPQGSRFSTFQINDTSVWFSLTFHSLSPVFQSSRAGDDLVLSHLLGNKKARATITTLGVALPTPDTMFSQCGDAARGSLCLALPLNISRSAHPEINFGDWKKSSRTRRMKRTQTRTSCWVMRPRSCFLVINFFLIWSVLVLLSESEENLRGCSK